MLNLAAGTSGYELHVRELVHKKSTVDTESTFTGEETVRSAASAPDWIIRRLGKSVELRLRSATARWSTVEIVVLRWENALRKLSETSVQYVLP